MVIEANGCSIRRSQVQLEPGGNDPTEALIDPTTMVHVVELTMTKLVADTFNVRFEVLSIARLVRKVTKLITM